MRKLLISLLLAGAAATPALADPGDHSDRHAEHQQARAERQQARAEQRQERSNNAERQQMRVAPQERPQFNGRQGFNGASGGGQQAYDRATFQQNVQDSQQGDMSRAERRAARQQALEGRRTNVDGAPLRQMDRPLPGVMRQRDRSGMVRDVPRRGTQPPLVAENHRRDNVHWDHNWRNDHRYDWRDWRNRHRSSFHLGFYFDPFGWGYQPFSIGWRLWPNYYSSNYWINDPWEYRLPYAPPGTRWIRYYNDALLVDTYTGEVVDAIRDFFW
jgi:Ni/Co efflux regulator RcnB